MHIALVHPARVTGLAILDVLPVGGPKSEVGRVLELMKRFDPGECASRRDAGEHLAQSIRDPSLASSILMNVGRRADGRLFWRLGVEEISDDFDKLGFEAPKGTYDGPCLFVRGGASSYFPPQGAAIVRERFPGARIECLEGAGHLLHVDRPDELRSLLGDFCDSLV